MQTPPCPVCLISNKHHSKAACLNTRSISSSLKKNFMFFTNSFYQHSISKNYFCEELKLYFENHYTSNGVEGESHDLFEGHANQPDVSTCHCITVFLQLTNVQNLDKYQVMLYSYDSPYLISIDIKSVSLSWSLEDIGYRQMRNSG